MRAYGTRASPVAGAPPGSAHRGAAGRPGTAQEGAADASAGGTGSCAGPGGKGCQGFGTDGPAFHGSGPVPAARGALGGRPDCPPGGGTCRAPGCTRAGGPGRGRAADLADAAATAGAACHRGTASDPDPDIAGSGRAARGGIRAWR